LRVQKELVVQRMRSMAIVLAVVVLTGCAAGRAMQRGETAAKQGDWDAAVAYYREALLRDPGRLDARVRLEIASRMASAAHVARARELQAQDHLPGAAAEYRLAADLDSSNTLALTNALQLERRIRDQIEAARPQARIEGLREQAAQTSPFPTLDPRTSVPGMRFTNTAVRDILDSIGKFTGIDVTYDQGVESYTGRPYSIDISDQPLEEILNQVLTANTLTFKIINPRTIFVYQDSPQKRQQFEEVYVQTFYINHADLNDVQQLVTQLTQQGTGTRPVIQPQKAANALVVKATAPVLQIIDSVIKSIDKPRAEVIVDVEILEVSRIRAKQLGIDLSDYAIGFTLSPEVAPPNTGGTFPPAVPPPFNINTVSQGVSRNDFYATIPTAQLRLLATDTHTKTLAKSQLRGSEGAALTLALGDDIPVAQTTFGSVATGGVQTIPQTQYSYRRVGVNVTMTPRVTYNEEIILDPLTVERSGLGGNINVAGVSLPSFVARQASTSMRLRDGESNMLAGLISEADRKTMEGIPGIMDIPILRDLFGNRDSSREDSELVMIVTPHIVRGRDLTADDVRPFYVGTGNNLGARTQPQLIAPGTPLPAPTTPPSVGRGGAPPAPGQVPPPAQTPPPAGETPPVRAPGVVPIEPVGGAAQPPAGIGQLVVTAPGAEWQAGGPPYTVPVTVIGVSTVGTVAVTITYDPKVLRATSVTQGTFMAQGGASPTFTPKIDQEAGRIDIAIARPGNQTGAAGDGLLAGIVFEALAAGSTQIAVAGVATTPSGQAVPLRMVPASVTVR
jgi:general secretion pathway protein D